MPEHVVGANYVRTSHWMKRLEGKMCPDGHPMLPSSRICRLPKEKETKTDDQIEAPQNPKTDIILYESVT